jgi:hypothetical protein
MENKLEFKAEDFKPHKSICNWWDRHSELAAEMANARLREMLDIAPKVMGYADGITWYDIKLRESADDYSHRARLVEIEPIDKEPK